MKVKIMHTDIVLVMISVMIIGVIMALVIVGNGVVLCYINPKTWRAVAES